MFVINTPFFSLDQTYVSKQVPRWMKLKESKYIVIHQDKALLIEQKSDRLLMNCSEQDFYNIWFHYFDFKTDYLDINTRIKRLGKKFKIIANRGKGVHLLQQDLWESYVYSNLIYLVGYDKAKKAMNHIAETCGKQHVQSMREAGRVTWYEWPTPQMINANLDKLKRMGPINKWLKSEIHSVLYDEEYMRIREEKDLYRLFGLHDLTVFSTKEIEETLKKNFGDIEEFEDWYLDDIKEKGLVYLYILYHINNRPKEGDKIYGVSR